MQPSKIEKPKDEWISVKFPRLISDERWDQIQARIEYQKRKPRKRHKGLEKHFMCENVLYCGECGAKMKKQPLDEKNKRKQSYYVCYWKSSSKKQLVIHGRERCNSKHWNADHIDQWIYDEIVNCMVAPSKYAKSWLKDIDIEKIQFKLDRLRNMEKEQRSKIEAAYDLITNERNAEIKAKYLEKKKKDDKIYERILADIRAAKSELNLAQNKTERLTEFESAFKKASLRKKFGLAFRREGHLKKYLYELPFNEKKRILEGVISPETDGKCRIRYVTPDDFMDDRINTTMSKEERIQPLKNYDPIIEMDFGLDMDKIETLINGLNKTKLYREFDKDRITVE